MDAYDEFLLDTLEVAVVATLESIAVWPEPTSPQDAVKMLADRLADDLGLNFVMPELPQLRGLQQARKRD